MNAAFSLCLRIAMLMLAFGAALSPSQAAVSAGGLAVVGYDDAADVFTLVALDAIAAGEVIYMTNNGWNASLGSFNGASPYQGAGNESLIKLTTTGIVAKGTVFSSASSGASWSWTKTGIIPGQAVGGINEFSDLAFEYESDQIYIFQAADSNPLSNPTGFIYALHFGSADYPTFVDADGPLNGNVPFGLSTTANTAFAHTNFSFHGDADGNNSSWGLNMASSAVASLHSSGGHKEDWLAVIGSSSNWSAGQPGASMIAVMPEPSRALLLGLGAFAPWVRRRR